MNEFCSICKDNFNFSICRWRLLLEGLSENFTDVQHNSNPYYEIYPSKGYLKCYTQEGILYGDLSAHWNSLTNSDNPYWDNLKCLHYFEQIIGYIPFKANDISRELNCIFDAKCIKTLDEHRIYIYYEH